MAYKYLEGLTMADVAFEATGKTLEEMLVSAADAMMNTQVKDLGKIEPREEREFCIHSADEERLLHDFLQELIFYKDAERLLFAGYSLRAARTEKGYRLEVKARGEQLDMRKHTLLVDVKAVSWHKFRVEKTAKGWKAVVIIDV